MKIRTETGEKNSIGPVIIKKRLEFKMRQYDLLVQLHLRGINISASTLSKIEGGLIDPRLNIVIALAQIFSCSIDELIVEEDE